MPIDITDQLRRIVYFGNDTTGPFSFPFEIINDTDLGIYVNDTLLTITSDYTVDINPDGTGEITLVIGSTLSVEPTGTDSIGIFGNKGIQRQTDFTTGGDLFANSLNDEFDAQTIFAQQNSEAVQRSLRAPITDPTDINMLLPSKTDRKGTVLGFNATTGNPEIGPTIADVSSLADITADIATLADIEDGTDATDAIQTVAGISSNVSTVAGISSNVTTVAGNNSNVTTCATNIAAINAAPTEAANAAASATAAAASETAAAASEAAAASSASSAATSATSSSTSATNAANSATAAATSATNAQDWASSTDFVEDGEFSYWSAKTAADASKTFASHPEDSQYNVQTGPLTGVSGYSALHYAAKAEDSATAAATSETNAAASESAASTSETNAASSATAAASSASSAATSASNASASADAALAALDSFDDRYLGQKASDPTLDNDGNALVAGALYFNTTDDVMKVYEGSTWVAAYASLSGALLVANNLSDLADAAASRTNLGLGTAATTASTDYATAAQGTLADSAMQDLVDDTTPQLGGNLDLNSNDITGTGDIDISGTLDVDGGTIKLNGNYPVGLGNVALGRQALYSNTTGNYNLAIGDQAAYNITTNYNLAIGNNSLYTNTTGVQNTAVGYETLKVSTGSSCTALGFRAAYNCTTGFGATALGDRALYSQTGGSYNTAVGYLAGFSTTNSSDCTFVGFEAGRGYNFAGRTIVGANAGYYAWTYTTALGAYAGRDALASQNSVFVGYYAGRGSTSYSYSNNNVAIGKECLYQLYGGDNNVAIGYQAGYAIGSSSSNTFLGYHAGLGTTDNGNSYIGYAAGANADGNYNTAIGYQAGQDFNGDRNVALGSFCLDESSISGSYNIGLGYGAQLSATTASNECQIGAPNGSTGQTTRLDVGGCDFSMNTTALYYGAEIRSGGDIVAYYSSDINLKENIQNIPDALSKVNSIRGVTYDWKDDYLATKGKQDDYFNRKHDVGVIAQEVEAVLPEVVAERADGTKAVRYEKLTALLIEAVNDLTAEVKTLKAELKELKDGIS